MKCLCSAIFFLAATYSAAYAAEFFSDIPGDGVITCGPNAGFQPVCPGGVGTVNITSGVLTGVLREGGSSLGINLADTAAFLTFAAIPSNPNNPPNYNPEWLGPLGLNPRFQPSASNVGDVGLPANRPPLMAYFDATVPLSGQEITVSVQNNSATTFTSLSFFLGRDVDSLSTSATRQNDGLTFGFYCSGQMHAQGTPKDCAIPQNWSLLLTPTGSGILDPLDLDPSSATFGDVLRFNSLDIAPGQSGQFTFFLSDYSSTRTPPGGVFTAANPSFVLEVAPNVQPVPEPDNILLVSLGVIALLGWKYSTRMLIRSK